MEVMRSFAALLLICAVVDMLLPAGATRGYARLAMGVMVILAMIVPIAGALGETPVLADEVMAELDMRVAASLSDTRAVQRLNEKRVLAVLESAGIEDGNVYIDYDDAVVKRVLLSGTGGAQAKHAAVLGVAALLSLEDGGVSFE